MYNDAGFGFTDGINPNTFSDFQREQAQLSMSVGMNDQSVIMYAFTPKVMPIQVSRPYVYQFTPQFMDAIQNEIMQPDVTFPYAVGKDGSHDPSLKKAILPDSTGMVMDTSLANQLWSFVLVINIPAVMVNGVLQPAVRQIAVGYISDEPADMMGNMNPSAVVMFTHSSLSIVKRAPVGMTTPVDGLKVFTMQDSDFVNEATSMRYNENVYLGTPREIMEFANQQKANPGFTNYSSLDISHAKLGTNNTRSVDSSLKAPKHQLSDIMSAIDNGVNGTLSSGLVESRFNAPIGSDGDLIGSPNAESVINSTRCMPSSATLGFTTRGSLDTSRSYSLTELDQKFPNMILRRFRVSDKPGYGWDSVVQATYMPDGRLAPFENIRNQLSSLVSNVCLTICGQLGIVDVAFNYMHLRPGFGIDAPGNSFSIEQGYLNTAIPRGDAAMRLIATQFRNLLEEQLFDIIDALAGAFELHVMMSLGGDILVNLRLYDYPDAQDSAYYHTSSRFGGMLNPMVAPVDIINTNVLALSNATDALVQMGLNRYASGPQMEEPNNVTMDFGDMPVSPNMY